MLESIENNFIYWMLGFAVISLILTIYGQVTSRNLPKEQRKIRVRKFALIGAAIFFFAVPIFKPMIYSTSGTKYLDEIKIEETMTPEQHEKLEKLQARQIETLKEDVLDLRRDVRRLHLFYSSLFQLFASLAATLCLIWAFKKDDNAVENITD